MPTALEKLDEIETEMRRVGYWSDSLAAEKCAVPLNSALDASSFQIWLRRLFLPNARAAALDGTLPAHSQAGEIVRRQFGAELKRPEARRLFEMIREFDALCFELSSRKDA